MIVVTGGHVHPGGMYTDLLAAAPRPGPRRALLFRSKARYWEPAGPVSWDMAMTISKPGYRVAIKKGDTLGISATYETDRASWYEGMGIIIAYVADGRRGVDPFKASVDAPTARSPTVTCPRTTTTAARLAACPTRSRCSPPLRAAAAS